MTDYSPNSAAPQMERATPPKAPQSLRDPRLDFYRGLAMFIILIAHTPGNFLTRWIPARFGFSDATEIFVFCSGMASAIAFGRVFRDQGPLMGSARVGFRVWQVYWAHIGLFFAIAMSMAALNATGLFERDYVGQLNLYPFFNNTETNLVGLMTLTYVPNYFDILPMYMVILAMMPVMIILARVHIGAMLALMAVLWLTAQEGLWAYFGLDMSGFEFPAEPWSQREWFFNPLGWQLVFFTGFALMAGWLPAPKRSWWLFGIALTIVLITIPLDARRVIYDVVLAPLPNAWADAVLDFRGWLRSEDHRWLYNKTDFGPLRYIHFLALAYLGWFVAGVKGQNLVATGSSWLALVWRFKLTQILKVGQQSLAVFVVSMLLARFMGMALDVLDINIRDIIARNDAMYWFDIGQALIVNLIGFAILIAVAHTAAWFKSAPWRKKKATS